MEAIKGLVDGIDGAQLLSNVGSELSFRLPMQSSHMFPTVLASLEAHATRLGIDSFGIGVTTMEEVFLRVSIDSQAHGTDGIGLNVAAVGR